MKVLLIGVGGVGEAIAVVAHDRPWLEKMVLADLQPGTRQNCSSTFGQCGKIPH